MMHPAPATPTRAPNLKVRSHPSSVLLTVCSTALTVASSATSHAQGVAAPGAQPSAPSPTTAPTLAPAPGAAWQSKKDRTRAEKSKQYDRTRVPAVGHAPAKLVSLRNTWTDEWLAIEVAAYVATAAQQRRVRQRGGTPPEKVAPAQLARFLRCHYTNRTTDMRSQLADFVVAAAAHFGASTVDVVSAFRHPKYNLALRKKGHQVAAESQHTHGHAIDFRLRGVTTQALRKWAIAQGRGGVGYYPVSKFIHMDVGPVRTWNGE